MVGFSMDMSSTGRDDFGGVSILVWLDSVHKCKRASVLISAPSSTRTWSGPWLLVF